MNKTAAKDQSQNSKEYASRIKGDINAIISQNKNRDLSSSQNAALNSKFKTENAKNSTSNTSTSSNSQSSVENAKNDETKNPNKPVLESSPKKADVADKIDGNTKLPENSGSSGAPPVTPIKKKVRYSEDVIVEDINKQQKNSKKDGKQQNQHHQSHHQLHHQQNRQQPYFFPTNNRGYGPRNWHGDNVQQQQQPQQQQHMKNGGFRAENLRGGWTSSPHHQQQSSHHQHNSSNFHNTRFFSSRPKYVNNLQLNEKKSMATVGAASSDSASAKASQKDSDGCRNLNSDKKEKHHPHQTQHSHKQQHNHRARKPSSGGGNVTNQIKLFNETEQNEDDLAFPTGETNRKFEFLPNSLRITVANDNTNNGDASAQQKESAVAEKTSPLPNSPRSKINLESDSKTLNINNQLDQLHLYESSGMDRIGASGRILQPSQMRQEIELEQQNALQQHQMDAAGITSYDIGEPSNSNMPPRMRNSLPQQPSDAAAALNRYSWAPNQFTDFAGLNAPPNFAQDDSSVQLMLNALTATVQNSMMQYEQPPLPAPIFMTAPGAPPAHLQQQQQFAARNPNQAFSTRPPFRNNAAFHYNSHNHHATNNNRYHHHHQQPQQQQQQYSHYNQFNHHQNNGRFRQPNQYGNARPPHNHNFGQPNRFRAARPFNNRHQQMFSNFNYNSASSASPFKEHQHHAANNRRSVTFEDGTNLLKQHATLGGSMDKLNYVASGPGGAREAEGDEGLSSSIVESGDETTGMNLQGRILTTRSHIDVSNNDEYIDDDPVGDLAQYRLDIDMNTFEVHSPDINDPILPKQLTSMIDEEQIEAELSGALAKKQQTEEPAGGGDASAAAGSAGESSCKPDSQSQDATSLASN